MLEDEYLDEHYPGYKKYIKIYLPDNGRRIKNIEFKPYTISEEY